MGWLEVVMEEYKALWGEVLTSMKMQQSILSFGTATVGIVYSAGFACWEKTPLPEIIFLFLIPTLIYLVVFVWLGEVGRMFRAGSFLATIEEKVNSQFTEKEQALSWVRWLSAGEWAGRRPHYQIRFHYFSIYVIFIVMACASIAIGNFKLYPLIYVPWITMLNVVELAILSMVILISIKIAKTIVRGELKTLQSGHNQAMQPTGKAGG